MQKIVGKSLKPCRERYTYQLARRYFHRHQQYWHDFQMFSHQMLTFTLYSKCLKQIIQLRNYYGSTNFPVHLNPDITDGLLHMFVPINRASLAYDRLTLAGERQGYCVEQGYLSRHRNDVPTGTRFGMVHTITIGATFKSQSCWHDATRFTFPPRWFGTIFLLVYVAFLDGMWSRSLKNPFPC